MGDQCIESVFGESMKVIKKKENRGYDIFREISERAIRRWSIIEISTQKTNFISISLSILTSLILIQISSSPQLSSVYSFQRIYADLSETTTTDFIHRFLLLLIIFLSNIISAQNASIRFLTWVFEYLVRNDSNLVPSRVHFIRKNCVFTLPKISHLMISRNALIRDFTTSINLVIVGQ